MEIIFLDDILKKYRKNKVLNGLTLNVEKGEILGIMGKSGCGKTTLLKGLIGMINYDSGKIYFNGEKINILNKNFLRNRVGFASQENMLYEELTLMENIVYYGKLYNLKKSEIIENASQLLGLSGLSNSKRLLIKNFSGGMKKRANILVSLVHDPDVLILDEPTTGLDPILRSSIWEYILKINKQGKTVIVSSHLIEELQEYCTNVAFMHRGRILGKYDIKDKEKFSEETLNKIFIKWLS